MQVFCEVADDEDGSWVMMVNEETEKEEVNKKDPTRSFFKSEIGQKVGDLIEDWRHIG